MIGSAGLWGGRFAESVRLEWAYLLIVGVLIVVFIAMLWGARGKIK